MPLSPSVRWGLPGKRWPKSSWRSATRCRVNPRRRSLASRTFLYREGGYEFEAAELSIPAPEGLSGAPVFNRERRSEVQAVVSWNHEERTERVREETITAPGHKQTLAVDSIVSYGIAVLLDPLRDWLDEHVPIPARLVE